MPIDLRDLSTLSEEELAEKGRQSHQFYKVTLELQSRQTKAQIEAAEYAKRSVRWMFWSVMVLAAASLGSFVLDLLTFMQGSGGS